MVQVDVLCVSGQPWTIQHCLGECRSRTISQLAAARRARTYYGRGTAAARPRIDRRISRSHAAQQARIRCAVPRSSHGRHMAAADDVHHALRRERFEICRGFRGGCGSVDWHCARCPHQWRLIVGMEGNDDPHAAAHMGNDGDDQQQRRDARLESSNCR